MTRSKAKTDVPIAGLHLECDRVGLLAALVAATSSLPARPTSPVLAGVRLDAADRELTVSSFDYDVSTRIRLDASVLGAGTVLLEGKRLHDLLKKSRGESVRIFAAGAKAVVEPGPSRFELGTLPIAKYPVLPDLPKPGGTVFVQQFLGTVKKVLLAVGQDGAMPMLAGVRMEFGPDTMTLVATDRYRLTVAEIPWFPDDPEAEHAPLLIPAAILKTIATRWKAATGRARIGIGGGIGGGTGGVGGLGISGGASTEATTTSGVVGFAHGAESCTARLLPGEFVSHRTLFAPAYPLGVVVETAPLKAATELITLVAGGAAPVELAFAPGEVVVSTGAANAAHGSEAVPALYDGPPFSVSFNPQHLLDWLGASDRGFVRIAIARPSKPVVLTGHDTPVPTGDNGVRYLMMPKPAPGQTEHADPPLPDYASGRPMLPWHAAEYVTEFGDGCPSRALRRGRTSRKEIAEALAQLANPLYPADVADRPGAVLLRNLSAEVDAFARWRKTSTPVCAARCASCGGSTATRSAAFRPGPA